MISFDRGVFNYFSINERKRTFTDISLYKANVMEKPVCFSVRANIFFKECGMNHFIIKIEKFMISKMTNKIPKL
ncbi:hypothetical protein MC64_017210 [Aeromonas caviae]|nr:hypothetical protein MC64_017210 [Aeromonas caviae]